MEQIKLVQSRRGSFIEKEVWLKGAQRRGGAGNNVSNSMRCILRLKKMS